MSFIKVKDLIAALSKQDPEANVAVAFTGLRHVGCHVQNVFVSKYDTVILDATTYKPDTLSATDRTERAQFNADPKEGWEAFIRRSSKT